MSVTITNRATGQYLGVSKKWIKGQNSWNSRYQAHQSLLHASKKDASYMFLACIEEIKGDGAVKILTFDTISAPIRNMFLNELEVSEIARLRLAIMEYERNG